jgi:hypothetical protein
VFDIPNTSLIFSKKIFKNLGIKMFKVLILLLLTSNIYANGERLFNDVRFSKLYVENSANNVNDLSAKGSSCITCHQVDAKFDSTTGLGMRVYSDFTKRSDIPLRSEDNLTHTLRNTPGLVGIGSPYLKKRFSHWDAEFADHSETVLGNFTGRNMGWLKNEIADSLRNIVKVIKLDDGLSDLAREFGGSYESVFLGVDPSIADEFRLPVEDRLDVLLATDKEIQNKVIEFITAFMNDLDFEKNSVDEYNGSPYDQFLKANNLPLKPKKNQTIDEYMSDLRLNITSLKAPIFVAKKFYPTVGKELGFGEKEYQGMKVFYNISKPDGSSNSGMCMNCHKPPMFTDEQFHNIGITQIEYDGVHGSGEFNKLNIPSLKNRKNEFMAKRPVLNNKSAVDLGVWNFFGRQNKPELNIYVRELKCNTLKNCSDDVLLPLTIATFKTPTLRNLAHSAPYFHSGASPHLMHLLHQYKRSSELMRRGELRNGDPLLKDMFLFHNEIHSLMPFLNSLNSNYD